jgi:glycosyltransferase involved in cell wall biosynthesis
VPDPNPRISIIVTVLNDRRLLRTLHSLQGQTLPPGEIWVADGGSTDGTFELAEDLARSDPRIRPLRAPGTIAESRNQALRRVSGEFVAFLDADEVAPPGWLAALVAPLVQDPSLGFTAGPTPALEGTATSVGARYYDAYLRRFYEEVARHHPHALPMGNSAWRMEVFHRLGLLDTTLFPRASSEDQEMAVRTLKAGWRALYVPEAWVGHDFSDLNLTRLLRKQATYAEGGFVLWRRIGSTYEASTGRLLPYVMPALLGLIAGLLALDPVSRPGAVIVALAGGVWLVALVTYLAAEGWAGDRRYPGWRYRPLEVLRRWATLVGAVRGWVHYGWSGRRGLPPAKIPPSRNPE